MPQSTARLKERKFETSQGENLKFINKAICINSNKNTGSTHIAMELNCSQIVIPLSFPLWLLSLRVDAWIEKFIISDRMFIDFDQKS